MFKARTHLLPFLASTIALVVSASSCSVLIDTKKTQCDTTADCTQLDRNATCDVSVHVCVSGAAPECVKNEDCSKLDNDDGAATCSDGKCVAATPPELLDAKGCVEPTKSTEEFVTLTFDVSLTAAAKVPKPFTIRGCNTTDPLCASPATEDFVVPYGEKAKIKVKPGFRGYLEIRNPDGLSAIEFLGRPINVDTTGYSLIIPTPTTVSLLILATGETYNSEQGIFVITTRDCDRQPLAGVAVKNTLGGTGFIFDNMSPQKSLKETTDEGAAGFVNVPAGLTSVTAVLDAKQKMTSTSAYSRGTSSIPDESKAWVTYVEIFP